MQLEKFKELIEKLKDVSDRTSRAYEANVDLIEYNNTFHEVIHILLKEILTEDQLINFEWFIFEKDFGRAKDMKTWDEKGKEILKDVEGLYNYIFLKK